MTQGSGSTLEDQLRVVRKRFISLLDERLDELEVLRDQITHENKREEALKQIQFISHKIAGTAGTLGFSETGEMAARTENAIIQNLTSNGISPTFEDTIKIIDAFLDNAADISSTYYWN